MSQLRPMRAEAYAAYLHASVAGYAEDNVAAGRWPAEGAEQRSRDDFAGLLPQGLYTPDNHLFEIIADDSGATVGFLWFAVEQRHGLRGAFVFDVSIHEAHRRQGHAERAFVALEALVAQLGLGSIGLHVFGQNAAAQALYRKLGYAVTGINMQKKIADRA
jgi:ribosomal protein S18 acetylase RimI-like enzyme